MGTETRIGIVAGLVIVVIASLYFFYQNDRKEDDLLATSGQHATPPQIPVSLEKQTAMPKSTPRRGPVRRSPSAGAPTRSEGLATGEARPAARPPLATHFQGSPSAPSPTGSATATNTALANAPAPSSLRTGPSPTLLDAVKENLRRSQPSAAAHPSPGPLALGPAAEDRGARTFGRPAANPPAAKPTPIPSGPAVLNRPRPSGADPRPGVSIPPAPRSLDRPKEPAAQTPRVVADKGPSLEPTPAEVPAKTYTVRSGDTFYAIAKHVYGSSKRWEELYRLNKDLVHGDPKKLAPGMVIRLPK